MNEVLEQIGADRKAIAQGFKKDMRLLAKHIEALHIDYGIRMRTGKELMEILEPECVKLDPSVSTLVGQQPVVLEALQTDLLYQLQTDKNNLEKALINHMPKEFPEWFDPEVSQHILRYPRIEELEPFKETWEPYYAAAKLSVDEVQIGIDPAVSLGDFLHTRAKENGFWRKICPPVPVTANSFIPMAQGITIQNLNVGTPLYTGASGSIVASTDSRLCVGMASNSLNSYNTGITALTKEDVQKMIEEALDKKGNINAEVLSSSKVTSRAREA